MLTMHLLTLTLTHSLSTHSVSRLPHLLIPFVALRSSLISVIPSTSTTSSCSSPSSKLLCYRHLLSICERGFSLMNLLKTTTSQMGEHLLRLLMVVCTLGAEWKDPEKIPVKDFNYQHLAVSE